MSFPSQLFKNKKVSKNEGTRKVEHAYDFRKCVDALYQKLSKLVHACQNYSLPKLARFFETQLYTDNETVNTLSQKKKPDHYD